MVAQRKVLVVDDEATICAVVADCLGDWPGTEVECAHDRLDAVNRLKGAKFDLALIDVELPGISGRDVAEAAVNDNTLVLMLAGHPDTFAKMTLVDLRHLAKPFGMTELLRESQNVVANARDNIARVRASLVRLKERAVALQTAMKESRRMLGESMMLSARAAGGAPK